MTEGTPWKQIFRFSLPVYGGLLLQQLYHTVDTIIVGNFAGETSLSAVGTTGVFTYLFLAVAVGFSAGAGVLISQLFGAGDREGLVRHAAVGIRLLLRIGLIVTVVGLALTGPVFRHLLNVQESYLNGALVYSRIYLSGLLFQFGYNIVAALLRSMGDSKASLYFLMISSGINIVLDLLFVAGFGLGVAGAAVATVIAQAGSCFASFRYLWKRYPEFRYSKDNWQYDRDIASGIVRQGIPITLQQMIASLGLLFVQRVVNGFGQAMTASYTVAMRIETYIRMPISTVQVAMATYTGQNIGAGNMKRVEQGMRQGLLLAFAMTGVLAFLAITFSHPIIGLFGISEAAEAFCSEHIRVTALAMLVLAGYMPILGVFQGAGDGYAVTRTSIFALVVRVLSAYTLYNREPFGYRIVWYCILFGFIGGFTITWIHYLRGTWRNKRALKRA